MNKKKVKHCFCKSRGEMGRLSIMMEEYFRVFLSFLQGNKDYTIAFTQKKGLDKAFNILADVLKSWVMTSFDFDYKICRKKRYIKNNLNNTKFIFKLISTKPRPVNFSDHKVVWVEEASSIPKKAWKMCRKLTKQRK